MELLNAFSTQASVSNIVLKEYERGTTAYKIDKETIENLSKYLEFIPAGDGTYTITAKSYVGLIRLNDHLFLNILPKIEMKNLLSMLNYIFDMPLLFDEESQLAESEQLLKLLIKIFITKVRTLFSTGFRKSYLSTTENRGTLKGRVLVNENLKHNRFHLERIFCEYDDFTDDILINRIIKFTLFLLFQIDEGDFIRELRQLFSLFANVKITPISIEDIDSIKYTRLDEAYKPVHMMCRIFIEHIFVSHKFGEKRMFCFLMDMNRLFEDFVRNVLRKYSSLIVKAQPRQKYLDQTENVKIKPDIRFLEGGKQVLVADCKYKRLGKIEDDYQGSRLINSDFYQILAYMIGYNQDKGMLIYPKSEVDQEIESSVDLDQKQVRIFVKPIDLDEIEEETLKKFVKDVETNARS